MNKDLSYKWAFALAILFLFLQILLIVWGMTLDNNITFFDYLAFFIAGLIVGAALVYLLRRSPSKTSTRAIIISFIIGLLFALMGMFLGGPSGSFGTILFSISPNIFVMIVGYVIGRIRNNKK